MNKDLIWFAARSMIASVLSALAATSVGCFIGVMYDETLKNAIAVAWVVVFAVSLFAIMPACFWVAPWLQSKTTYTKPWQILLLGTGAAFIYPFFNPFIFLIFKTQMPWFFIPGAFLLYGLTTSFFWWLIVFEPLNRKQTAKPS